MRYIRKFILCIMISAIVLSAATLLCACSEQLENYEFTEAEEIYVRYPGLSQTALPLSMYPLYYGNERIDIYADDYISQNNLNRVATYTMQVLDTVSTGEKITCYVSKRLTTQLDYDRHTMYLSELDVKSYDHLINTVTAAFGGKLPFGLVYGIAKRINDKFNWHVSFPSASSNKIKSLINDFPDAVDLQSSEFYEDTSDHVAAAKGAALSLCDFIERNEELIPFCKSLSIGDERLEQYKTAWAASLGVTRGESVPCAMSYLDGADEVVIRTEYADIAIPLGYTDYWNYHFGGDCYKYEKTYSGIKPYLSPILKDIAACQADIKTEPREIPLVKFGNSDEANEESNECYITSIANLFRIYAVYRLHIGRVVMYQNPYTNGVLIYLIYRYCENQVFGDKLLNDAGVTSISELFDFIEEKYPGTVGSIYDSAQKYYEACRLLAYRNAYVNEYSAVSRNALETSFALYVCENYGLDALYALADGKSYDEVFDKTLATLSDEWQAYNASLWE